MYFQILFYFAFMLVAAKAAPPTPASGFRWVLNDQYSDEFNGTELDASKWRDYYDGWKGRSPAKFVPSAVSVKNGSMQIKNGVLTPADGDYTIAGGAVQSKEKTAHFGYYEASFKASRISMSTTFWMSNGKVAVNQVTKKSNGVDCPNDKFSQELDICESIGGVFNGGTAFRTRMNFNTHYRYVDCNSSPEKFYSAGNNAVEGNGSDSDANLSSESWEEFHTYGVYWKDANEFDFYADDKFAGKVFAKTDVVDEPFPRTMGINMVTETYNWAKPYPTTAELNNNAINTSYYDWVRSYKLIPISEVDANPSSTKLYTENVALSGDLDTLDAANILDFDLLYWANQDREIHIRLYNASNVLIDSAKYNALAGFANNSYSLAITKGLSSGNYNLKVDISVKGAAADQSINGFSKTVYIKGEAIADVFDVGFTKVTSSLLSATSYSFEVDYNTSEQREIVLILNAPVGTWLGNKKQIVEAGTGTITLEMILAQAPAAGIGYKFAVAIRPVNGDFASNLKAETQLIEISDQITINNFKSIESNSNLVFKKDYISFEKEIEFTVLNQLGVVLHKGVSKQLSLKSLQRGLYILKLKGDKAYSFSVE